MFSYEMAHVFDLKEGRDVTSLFENYSNTEAGIYGYTFLPDLGASVFL